MFTGIIETRGTIKKLITHTGGLKIEIEANAAFIESIALGDSIAVDGICLTACELHKETFVADAMPRTVSLSHLGQLKINGRVNLERAMAVGARLGGHIVTGHIDGEAKLIDKKQDGIAYKLSFMLESPLLRQVVYSGSIAVNGVSLTVSELTETTFSVSLIPHTLKETGFGLLKKGDTVHIETDVIGKYVERYLSFKPIEKRGDQTCLSSAALTAFLMD